ncbi:MAG TPA: CoA transferase [Caulobacteraceae bacterium]|jgi:crotonobetainyl-CoA:carnitine CoA-transferase CaiB-like acyl-CoA transferase|nr:CoA transferase [Caulobacteraceae bacterium]
MEPLSGLRVVELADGVAAAYCGRQFATWGADVVVLEPEAGAPLRRAQPFATDPRGTQHSLLWLYVAANKRALADGLPRREALDALLSGADIFVTDYTDDRLAVLGVTLAGLSRSHPHLSIVSITPFGLSGPYAGFEASELVVQALSGYMASNGDMGRPPLRLPGHIGAYLAGVNGFVGALAAYYAKARGGRGDVVEVSEMETLSSITPFLRIEYMGGDKVRGGGPESGVRLFPCKDGYVSLSPLVAGEHARLCQVLDIPEGAIPADLLTGPAAEVIRRAFAFFAQYTREKTADAVFNGLEALGVMCGKLHAPADLLQLEQLRARQFYRTIEHPDLGPAPFAGPAARLANGRPAPPAPAPAAGEGVALSDLGWDRRPAPASALERSDPRPLHGLRVVDFTQAWIGPFATMMLGDLGADVIKIESHRRPDVWRQASVSPSAVDVVLAQKVNRSPNFNSVNRNKRNLTLDLSSEAARDLCRRLIATADVVAENYTPRVMERFGLGPAALAALKPDIVMFSSSGFGKSGPWSDYKSNGSAIEALAGWDWLHRYPGGEPVQMSFYQADAITGMQAAALIMVALVRRQATGEGEFIDAAMIETAAGYIGEVLLEAAFGEAAEGQGNRSRDFAPNGVFRCQGDDRWIAISAADDAAWARLVALPGAPAALRAPGFAAAGDRLANQDVLEPALEAWTLTRDAEALMAACQSGGVAAGVVRKVAEGLDDPHHAARGWFLATHHPDMGLHRYNGFLWRFASHALQVDRPPPRLGEHSEEVLREALALDDAEIADLQARGLTGAVL